MLEWAASVFDASLAMMLGLGFAITNVRAAGDTTPGGSNDVLIREDSGGILREDGTYFLRE